MKKNVALTNLKPAALQHARGGVVPVVLGGCTFDYSASAGSSSSQATSELGLTTVEQQR